MSLVHVLYISLLEIKGALPTASKATKTAGITPPLRMLADIDARLNSGEDITPDFIVASRHEIFRLLEKDKFGRYKNSSDFQVRCISDGLNWHFQFFHFKRGHSFFILFQYNKNVELLGSFRDTMKS
jgi:hypothetical protein